MTGTAGKLLLSALLACGALFASVAAAGQLDVQQMSGLPLPDPALPDGTITVRVIRGQISNNVSNQVVELRQGDSVKTATTDTEGRATFQTLKPGQTVQASTELDGQRIQSQSFTVPDRGGTRVMLVGNNSVDLSLSARLGSVTFGGESWIQVEVIEESVEVYYFFQVVNPGDVPVDSAVPIALDMPNGAEGTTVLEGSSPQTTVDGRHVELLGPFEPGATPFRVAYILPYVGDSLVISQSFPVTLDSLLVSVKKWGSMDVVSSQIDRRVETPPSERNGTPYILAAGPAIPVGRALSVEMIGLPHRSSMPRTVTLMITISILGVGVWGALGQPETTARNTRRNVMGARKEKLLADLVKVERQHRAGKIGLTRYCSRRQELFDAIEPVYRELDEQLNSTMLSPALARDPYVTRRSGTVG